MTEYNENTWAISLDEASNLWALTRIATGEDCGSYFDSQADAVAAIEIIELANPDLNRYTTDNT